MSDVTAIANTLIQNIDIQGFMPEFSAPSNTTATSTLDSILETHRQIQIQPQYTLSSIPNMTVTGTSNWNFVSAFSYPAYFNTFTPFTQPFSFNASFQFQWGGGAYKVKRTWSPSKKAEETSMALLKDILGDKMYHSYKKDGHIWVESRIKTGLAFEVRPHSMIKVHKKEAGVWKRTHVQLCIHPDEHFPEGDDVATKYLTARFDEEALWKTAIVHGNKQELELVAV